MIKFTFLAKGHLDKCKNQKRNKLPKHLYRRNSIGETISDFFEKMLHQSCLKCYCLHDALHSCDTPNLCKKKKQPLSSVKITYLRQNYLKI